MKHLPLNAEIIRKHCGLSPAGFAALIAPFLATGEELPDAMLQGLTPAVGASNVYPQYVGAVSVQPMYPGRGRVGAPAEMLAAGPGQAPVQYNEQLYNAGDVTWFGLGSTSILAGAQGQTVTVRPKRPFTPQQLYCPSNVQGLLITQVSIGGTNIFAGTDGVPIELLSEVSNVPMILWPSIDPSTGVEFTIANPTAGALVFRGALYGTQVRN